LLFERCAKAIPGSLCMGSAIRRRRCSFMLRSSLSVAYFTEKNVVPMASTTTRYQKRKKNNTLGYPISNRAEDWRNKQGAFSSSPFSRKATSKHNYQLFFVSPT